MNKDRFAKLFPLGSHLCREPMPSMNEMKRDMELLRGKGFNLIKLQENWMLDEPKEGEYRFEKYHELISYAEKLDMGVYLGLTCEQAPNWLWEKHPGCRMEHKNGTKAAYQAQSTLPADGKPGPCYDHPGAMADQLRFIGKLVSELGEHENIVVWNTWQEIGYWAEGLSGGPVCYCPNTVAFYRQWLESVYGTIDALNAHWNVRYDSFHSIAPERGVRNNCIPQHFYFQYFMDNVQTANVLTARCKAVKEADRYKRPVFAHKGGPAFGSGMDWTYSRTQDFLGTSNYPAWGSGHPWDDFRQAKRLPRHETLLAEMWDRLAYPMDYIRSAAKDGAPIWAAEYQGGPVSTDYHTGRVPNAGDMRRWMLTTMSAGATAISFWVARAEIMAPETNGFALLDSEGETTERLEEASRVGKALQQYSELFAVNNRPQADVAILINEWNYQLVKCLKFANDAYQYDIRGWYKALWTMGVPCDFVEASRLDEPGTGGSETDGPRAANYKVIIAPFALSMSDSVARSLIRLAENGVNLIFEGGCGRLGENAFAVRGQMNGLIREKLGVKVTRHALVREPGEDDRWSQPERTWGEYAEAGFMTGVGDMAGYGHRANIFIETYEADERDICFVWGGKPAGVRKQVGVRKHVGVNGQAGVHEQAGSGTMWLIGTALGPGATAYRDSESDNALAQLLSLCGVKRVHDGRLLITKRVSGDREAWFVTNPHGEAVSERIALPDGAAAADLLGGDVELRDGSVELTVEPLDVRVLIVDTTI